MCRAGDERIARPLPKSVAIERPSGRGFVHDAVIRRQRRIHSRAIEDRGLAAGHDDYLPNRISPPEKLGADDRPPGLPAPGPRKAAVAGNCMLHALISPVLHPNALLDCSRRHHLNLRDVWCPRSTVALSCRPMNTAQAGLRGAGNEIADSAVWIRRADDATHDGNLQGLRRPDILSRQSGILR